MFRRVRRLSWLANVVLGLLSYAFACGSMAFVVRVWCGGCARACVRFFLVVCKFFCVFLFLFSCFIFLLFLALFRIFVLFGCGSFVVFFSLFFLCCMVSSSFPFGARVLRAPSVFSLSGWLVGRSHRYGGSCSSVSFRLSARSVSGFVAVCSFSSFGAARAFASRAARFVGLFCVVRRVGASWAVSVPAVLPSGVAVPFGSPLAPAAWLGLLSAARRCHRYDGGAVLSSVL